MLSTGEKISIAAGVGLLLLGDKRPPTTNTGSVSNVDGGAKKPDYVLAAAAQREYARQKFGPPGARYPRTPNSYAADVWRWWEQAVRGLLSWTAQPQVGNGMTSVSDGAGGYFNFHGVLGVPAPGALSRDQFEKIRGAWDAFRGSTPVVVSAYPNVDPTVRDLTDAELAEFWEAVAALGIVVDVYQSAPDYEGEVWGDVLENLTKLPGQAVDGVVTAGAKTIGTLVDGLLHTTSGVLLLLFVGWKVAHR
jgi:hypothetical protein